MSAREPIDDLVGAPGVFIAGMVLTLSVGIGVALVIAVVWVAAALITPSPFVLPRVVVYSVFVIGHVYWHRRVSIDVGARSRRARMAVAHGAGVFTSWLLLAIMWISAEGDPATSIFLLIYGLALGYTCTVFARKGMRDPIWLRSDNICPTCGYSLENLPEPGCPECGYDRSPSTPSHNSP